MKTIIMKIPVVAMPGEKPIEKQVNPNNRLLTIPIDEWPKLLEQCDIDITGLDFGGCTYNYATLFEAHYCGLPAVAVQFFDADNWQDGLLRMIVAHKQVCVKHLVKAVKVAK